MSVAVPPRPGQVPALVLALARPAPGVPRARLWLAGLLGLGAVVASTGVVARVLFSQSSTPKYLLTVLLFVFAAGVVLLERPSRAMAWLAVFLLPLSGLSATFGPASLSLMFLLVVATVALRLLERPVGWVPSPLTSAVVVALVLLTVPFLTGEERTEPLRAFATLLAVGWIVAGVARDGGTVGIAVAFVASALVQSLVAFWEYATGSTPNFYGGAGTQAFGSDYFFGYEGVNRPVGTFTDPISLGNMLALALLLVLYLAVRRGAPALQRLAAAVAGVPIAIALVLALSRMSWIGAVAGVLVAALLLPRGMRAKALVAVVALGFAGVAIGLATSGPALRERAASVLSPTSNDAPTQRGDLLREQLHHDSLDIFSHHPVFGIGMGDLRAELVARTPEATTQGHAHSVYFSVLAEAGVVGFTGLVLVVLVALGCAWRGRRRDPALAAVAVGMIVATLIVWSTDYTIRYVPVAGVFAVGFGLCAALGAARGRTLGPAT